MDNFMSRATSAKRAVLGFLVTTICMAIVIGGAFWLKAETTHKNCEGINDLRIVLQKVLTRSQALAARNPDYSLTEKVVADVFYAHALADLEPTKC